MVDFKKFIFVIKFPLLIIVLLTLLFLMPSTLSRYQSKAISSSSAPVAYYAMSTNYFTDHILLDEILPSNEPYVYNFDISNTKNNKRTEVNLEYELSLKTTTNLPLRYYLYKNQNYTDTNANTIIISDITSMDDDGTYFRVMKAAKENFSYALDQINHYQLVVYFPETTTDSSYQGTYESIEITIDSKQIVDGD